MAGKDKFGAFLFGKPVKSKKKKKKTGRDADSNDDSDDNSSITTISSTSSSASSIAPILDGQRYAEHLGDRFARHSAAKLEKKRETKASKASKAKKKRQKRHTLSSSSSTSNSSLSIYDSEIEAIVEFEKSKPTSRVLKRLWKNVKHLKAKVRRLENAAPDTDSDDSVLLSKKKKKKPRQSKAKSDETEGVEKTEKEEGASTPHADGKSSDSASVKTDADKETLTDGKEEGGVNLEHIETKDDNDDTKEPFASDDKEKANTEDDEKASDGDDEDSSDEGELEEDNENSTWSEFELKYQFFYKRDQTELNRFYDDRISPFIRVRWDDINHSAATENGEADDRKGKVVAGEIDIIEICLESSVFRSFLAEITNPPSQFVPGVAPPPPPGMMSTPAGMRVGKPPVSRRPEKGRVDETVSFFKPFRWLVQSRVFLTQKAKELEEDMINSTESLEPLQKIDEIQEGNANDTKVEDPEKDLGAQIKFLLDFMDEYLAGPLKKYGDARNGDLKTIGFEDLWMLYTPGDIIYAPLRYALPTSSPPAPASAPKSHTGGVNPPSPVTYRQGFGRETPQAYKILSVAGGRRFAGPGPPGRMSNTHTPLKLVCYFLDLGGYRFDVVTDTFTFRPFDTEMVITDLDAYPLAYASVGETSGEAEMRRFLADRGKSFIEVSEASHKLYAGPAWTDSQNNKEEIDTPVIVDFALAYQNTPSWRPPFCVPYVDFYNTGVKNTRAEMLEVTFNSRTNRRADWFWSHQILLINRARIAVSERLSGYPVVGSVTSDPAIPQVIAAMEANEDILLLPGMVYAFALRDRKWDTQYEDGWKDLILPPGHKEMVRAVVENHAAGSRATGGMKKGSAEVDIVRGKGKGCIILLHGEPGVGKTSTAECVAAFTKRPLFPITCGDIGYEPDEVERNLQKHFTLAHKWGCVMLLDEADVFLAKRSRDDIKRNGLVSVFLRILEYYAGILFLTTNRVGSFDDAFRSRLHLTLYYPKLDKKQTLQIFDMNIRRVRELNSKREQAGQRSIEIQHENILRFARKHCETLSWNGRQIRNAFQTAIALAEFDVRDDGNDEPHAVMGKKQFKTIAKASIEFDNYLFHTHGGADQAAKARREQVRWDYEVEGRPARKPELIDSSSSASSESSSSSSSSDSSSEDSDSSADKADSSDSDDGKRRRKKKKKKGKGKDKKSKKSDGKSKKSKSKKDKHA